MRYFITIFVLLMAVGQAVGQKDKLYLYDNGYLQGQLLERNTDDLLFALNSSDTLQIAIKSVVSIHLKHKKERSNQLLNLMDSINDEINNRLYYEFGLGGHFDDSGDNTEFRVTFSGSVMYKISRYLQPGIALDYYRYAQYDVAPLYIKYLGKFSQVDNKGLFYYAAIGMSKAWKRGDCNCYGEEIKGGRITKIGLGYRFPMDEINMSFTLGWLQQRVSTSFDGYSEYYWFYAPTESHTVIHKRLNGIEIGIKFLFE